MPKCIKHFSFKSHTPDGRAGKYYVAQYDDGVALDGGRLIATNDRSLAMVGQYCSVRRNDN
jgi:hypothetical protein